MYAVINTGKIIIAKSMIAMVAISMIPIPRGADAAIAAVPIVIDTPSVQAPTKNHRGNLGRHPILSAIKYVASPAAPIAAYINATPIKAPG